MKNLFLDVLLILLKRGLFLWQYSNLVKNFIHNDLIFLTRKSNKFAIKKDLPITE